MKGGDVLSDEDPAHQKAREFFEKIWKQEDAWGFDEDPWERRRLDELAAAIADRHHPNALELGCGSGHLARRIAPLTGRLLGLDVSPAAIARAVASGGERLEYRVQNAMTYDPGPEGPWDLIVLSETVYYLGWLHPFFDVAWKARQLFEATRPGGRLLLANTLGEIGDALVLPFVVRSYHDLFRNAGYAIEHERVVRGEKQGVALEVLVSVFGRDPASHS